MSRDGWHICRACQEWSEVRAGLCEECRAPKLARWRDDQKRPEALPTVELFPGLLPPVQANLFEGREESET